MPTELSMFHGTPGHDYKPGDFLKSFRNRMRELSIVADATKVAAFADYMATGSPAEEWFNDPATDTTTWPLLEAGFTARFPSVTSTKVKAIEYERELHGLEVDVMKLAENEMYGGVLLKGYQAFAEKALQLAKSAKIATTASGIVLLRDKFPKFIRDKVREEQTDWTAFTTEIRNIPFSHIREGVEKYAQDKEEAKNVRLRLDKLERQKTAPNRPSSPVSRITAQLGRSAISSTERAPAQTTTRTQTRGNPRFLNTRNATEAEKNQLRESINKFVHHPNTSTGREAYGADIDRWGVDNGKDAYPTWSSGFPLRPGTEPVMSGECWNCGHRGHAKPDCKATHPLNTREQLFRQYCALVLGRNAAAVNHVGTSAEGARAWLDDSWLGSEEVSENL